MFEAWYFSYDYEDAVRQGDSSGDYSITKYGTLLGKYTTYSDANTACMRCINLQQYIALIWDPFNKKWK